jgi:hypothetical protein
MSLWPRPRCEGDTWIVWDQTETAGPILIDNLEDALKMIVDGGYIECDECGEVME